MEFLTSLLLVLILGVLPWLFHGLRTNPWQKRSGKLPPGPRRFPIIGNALQIGQSPHRSLAKLSNIYGPLMSLKLGTINTVVVSSPEIAREVLQKHGQVFSGRTIITAVEVHDHHRMSMAYIPPGNDWRKMRKICSEKMFLNHRLDATQTLRREKLQKLHGYVLECSRARRSVNVSNAACTTFLNIMSAMMFSVDCTSFDSDGAAGEVKEAIEGVGRILGAPNYADYFPILKRIDPQGIRKEARVYFGKLLETVEGMINQRIESREKGIVNRDDWLEALLDLRQGSEYEMSFNEIKHLLVVLLVGGSVTTTFTTEWAMAELLINPSKMKKAKDEIRSIVGEQGQVVQESDISRLPYLQAVIKEIFRLHPAGPLLVPRKAEADVEVNGYMIPKNTQILVNAWGMGRDPRIWSEPSSFKPERFLLDSNGIDFKGQDSRLIPFGSGRRMCPGMWLATRMLHTTVAAMINGFDWKLEAGMKPEEKAEIDRFGSSLQKNTPVVPLMAIPISVHDFQV
ncbi:ferruginol synthase-like [Andrographis paniculata]|uniref:ferruginol synthase-like n=1 Tax=Andrographis paniculata TaxID=175694 RepID=UPI0021E88296|nr:ferruginol synthase-like [Andrographis paniculata]